MCSVPMFPAAIAAAGGFFASGFKRAFKMKDFGDTIPGHGGVTDRFDCQMIMAMFAYVYYWTFVDRKTQTVGETLDVVQKLELEQQLELFAKLGNLLIGAGVLPEAAQRVVEMAEKAVAAGAIAGR